MFEYNCELSRVVDGDTVDLWVDLGFNIRVHERFRLARIDAPESRTKDVAEKIRGQDATIFLEKQLHTAWCIKVQTEKDKKGKYGRWIGTIYTAHKPNPDSDDWKDINSLMVTEGHAIFKDY